ncbi:MAG TPA: ribosome assembly factor SBDS [Methanosarcinales archaeon]|nr:ribosome assembly factor SBDS [Methanosarcinales archaeon]
MVTLDDAVIARLKKHGKNFEVYVDPDGALNLRKGEEVKIEDILAVEEVFENASRGDRPAEEDLFKTFGTTDIFKITAEIIKHGDLQLTSEQRKQIQEYKKKQAISIISRNSINPQTKAPHPPSRIEKAIEEAGVHIDPMKTVDELVTIIMKKIRKIIPIRFEEVEIAVKVPVQYAAKSYGEIANFGQLVKQEWQSDGSWIGIIKIPAGLQTDFYGLVNRLTKGDAETKLLE